MKITFEGDYSQIIGEMRQMVAIWDGLHVNRLGDSVLGANTFPVDNGEITQGPSPEPQGSEVPEVPEVKPAVSVLPEPKKRGRPAKAKPAAPAMQVEEPVEEPVEIEEEEEESLFKEKAPMSPAELAALREQTTEELRAAYSGGHEKAVTKLLKQYGNGATSFRELSHEAFIPIRKAIDEGALQ